MKRREAKRREEKRSEVKRSKEKRREVKRREAKRSEEKRREAKTSKDFSASWDMEVNGQTDLAEIPPKFSPSLTMYKLELFGDFSKV